MSDEPNSSVIDRDLASIPVVTEVEKHQLTT